jgi:hypothetical protein
VRYCTKGNGKMYKESQMTIAARWLKGGSNWVAANVWSLWRANGSSDSPNNVGHLVQRMQQGSRSQSGPL